MGEDTGSLTLARPLSLYIELGAGRKLVRLKDCHADGRCENHRSLFVYFRLRGQMKKARDLFDVAEFFEIFMSTPLEVCELRDAKGLMPEQGPES